MGADNAKNDVPEIGGWRGVRLKVLAGLARSRLRQIASSLNLTPGMFGCAAGGVEFDCIALRRVGALLRNLVPTRGILACPQDNSQAFLAAAIACAPRAANAPRGLVVRRARKGEGPGRVVLGPATRPEETAVLFGLVVDSGGTLLAAAEALIFERRLFVEAVIGLVETSAGGAGELGDLGLNYIPLFRLHRKAPPERDEPPEGWGHPEGDAS